MAFEPACTVVYQDGGREVRLPLSRSRVALGRVLDSDLVVPLATASRKHAVIQHRSGGWVISDLGSANGTYVNEVRIKDQQPLSHGDAIRLHTFVLRVEIAEVTGPVTGERVVFEEDDSQMTSFLAAHEVAGILGTDLSASPSADSGSPSLASDIERVTRSTDELSAHQRSATWSGAAALDLFSRAAEALLICEDLDDVLEQIMDLAFSELPAQRGLIGLVGDEDSGIVPRVVRSSDSGEATEIRVSSKIAKSVVTERKAFLIREVSSDDRLSSHDTITIVQMNIRSAVCAPLCIRDRMLGIIYLDTQDNKKRFGERDLRILTVLGMLAAIGITQTQFRQEIREQQQVRERLERYSSPHVVDRIASLTQTADMMAEEREVTIMFCDMHGFTRRCESLEPREAALLLNTLFERLTAVMFKHEGTLDKYTGDGMMVFFGAPQEQPDHAVRAVQAAHEMMLELEQVNLELAFEEPLSMRFGVNTGAVVAGDIGAEQRRDYTVIGDAVNVASRLEFAIAEPGQIIIGKSTYDQLADAFDCQRLDPIHVKNRREPVEPYLVLAPRDVAGKSG